MSACMARTGRHSDDMVQVWHGLESPAVACGWHYTFDREEVFAAHRELVAVERVEWFAQLARTSRGVTAQA